MKTILTFPPNTHKSIPSGFYWEGENDDPTFKAAWDFYQSIAKEGVYGTSGNPVTIERADNEN